jgi:hypothetical protein
VDWNNDGKNDLLAGCSSGKVWFFANTGTKENPVLAAGVQVTAGGTPIVGTQPKYEKDKDGNYRRVANNNDSLMGIYSKIHAADWNGDGLKDLLVGQDGPGGQQFVVYLNEGTASEPKLGKPAVLQLPEPPMSRPSPYVVDWDGDGVPDMLCGTESASVVFFRNTGTKNAAVFAKGVPLALKGDGFDKGYRCRICVTDWNNDGVLDLLVGNFFSADKKSGGNIWLFLGK